MQAQAYWTTGLRQGELRPLMLPDPVPGEVLVQTLYSGISRGTELLVAQGCIPSSQHERMRAPFQEGAFPFPVKYGYCNVGRVLAGPADLSGRIVFCLYPHQSAYIVPAASVTPLPDGVPPSRAILAANMETALNALWDAAPLPGERIHVIGAGAVGCLVAWLLRQLPGVELTLTDVDLSRAATAAALAIPFAAPEMLAPDADLILHASGNPAGLATALTLAAQEARIVELSWYGDRAVSLPLGEAFHSRRLRLLSSQVGSIAPACHPRWSHARRMAKAMSLLTEPALDALITHEAPFTELPTVMRALAEGRSQAICQRIVYPDR
jgi:threonine dehydrogenase-like Zn-dependent dehydrogenase